MPTLQLNDFSGGKNTFRDAAQIGSNEGTVVKNCNIDKGIISPMQALGAANGTYAAALSLYYWNSDWRTHTAERWYTEGYQGGAAVLYYATPPSPGANAPKKVIGSTTYNLGIAAPAAAPTLSSLTSDDSDTSQIPITGIGGGEQGILYVYTHYNSTTGNESKPSDPLNVGYDFALSVGTALTASQTSLYLNTAYGSPPAAGGAIIIDEEIIRFTSASFDGIAWTLAGCTRGASNTVPASHASNALCYGAYSAINISGLTAYAGTDPQVTHKRLYRLVANEYRRVDTDSAPILDATTSYTDTNTDADLLEASILTSDDNTAPTNLTGIAGPYKGSLVGWLGNIVSLSKQGKHDAWPAGDYEYTFKTTVAACVLYADYIVVLCQDGLYTLFGDSPDQLQMSKPLNTWGCITQGGVLCGRTAIDCGNFLVYLSPDGLVAFDGSNSRVITDGKLARSEFSLTSPCAAYQDQQYYLFHSTGCIIADFRGGGVVFKNWVETSGGSPIAVLAAHRRSDNDSLNVLRATGLCVFGAGSDLSWEYTTGELSMGDLSTWKRLHSFVLDSSGTVDVVISVDGTTKYTTSGASFSGSRASRRRRMVGSGHRPKIAISGTGTMYGLGIEFDTARAPY